MRALLLTALIAAACAGGGAPPPGSPGSEEPPAIPDPSVVDAAPEVRELIAERTDAVRADPDVGAAWLALGMAYDAHYLFHVAEVCYAEAARLAPEEPRAWYHLARARAELSRVEEAVADVERSIALEGDHAPSHWRRGFWLLDLGRTDEAAEAFRRATEIDPGDDAGFVGLARVALERGDPGRAAELLEAVLERRPENGYARQLLGSAYRGLGRTEDAERALARSQHTRPRWMDSWKVEVDRIATSLLDRLERLREEVRAGRGEAALDELEELRRENPTHIAVLSTLTPALVQCGRIERAIEVNRVALTRGRDHTRVHLNLALLFPQVGRTDLAIEHARRAVELNPASSDAHLQLGRLLGSTGALELAAEELEQAIENGDDRVSTHLDLARTRARLSEWPEAERVLERAAVAHADSGQVFALLAAFRAEQDDLDGAREAWDRAARLGFDRGVLDEIAEKIAAHEARRGDGG